MSFGKHFSSSTIWLQLQVFSPNTLEIMKENDNLRISFKSFCMWFGSFLVACTQLYKSLCWSVGRSIGPSVGRSPSNKNEPNKYNKAFSALEAISDDSASAPWSVYGLVTAPAQKHATDDAVYTAFFEID